MTDRPTLQRVLDLGEDVGRFTAVDHSVVEGEAEPHDRGGGHLAVPCHGPGEDPSDTECDRGPADGVEAVHRPVSQRGHREGAEDLGASGEGLHEAPEDDPADRCRQALELADPGEFGHPFGIAVAIVRDLFLDLRQVGLGEVGEDGGEYGPLSVEGPVQRQFGVDLGVVSDPGKSAALDRGVRLGMCGQDPGAGVEHVAHQRVAQSLSARRLPVAQHLVHVDFGVEEDRGERADLFEEVQRLSSLSDHLPTGHGLTARR